MGGRRDDSAPCRIALPPVPARPAAGAPAARSAAAPRADEPPSAGRRGWLVVGLVLAAGATAAVFFTEDPHYLRVALLAVCWAFVVAAFLAGNRRTDQVAAAAREAELRHAYDLELEREVAARHEYEVELESRLRREAEQAMRGELAALHTQLAGLSTLQDDLAEVTRLRADLAGLGQLRTEIAGLTEFRGELAGLGQLRAELAGLGELRTDLGRMRSELTEQLSGELLIERMVMRAQSVRGPAQPSSADGRTLDGAAAREPQLGGWDVDRWQETRVVPAEPVPAPRPVPGPPPVPPSTHRTSARFDAAADADAAQQPPSPLGWLMDEPVAEQRPRFPLEWHRERPLVDDDVLATGEIAVASPPEPRPAPRHHRRAAEPEDDATAGASYDSSRYDALLFGSAPPESRSYEPAPSAEPARSYRTPSWESSGDGAADETPGWSTGSTSYQSAGYQSSGYAGPAAEGAPAEAAPRSQPEVSGHARLEQILAESGVGAPTGGRSRRRRYRDEDGGTAEDDVLARVLGRS